MNKKGVVSSYKVEITDDGTGKIKGDFGEIIHKRELGEYDDLNELVDELYGLLEMDMERTDILEW